MKTIRLGMSGGVDSAVAALLLKQEQYDVRCVTMLLAPETDASSKSVAAAEEIASQLACDFELLDLREEFRSTIIESFISEYESGRTPNPCCLCNPLIKFRYLDDGESLIATGHYARIIKSANGRYAVRKATNHAKDQSYFLYGLSQDILSRTVFPLGDFAKDEVRRLANENGFVNAHSKDSQDICFIPSGDYSAFISEYNSQYARESVGTMPGYFVDLNGKTLGQHRGIINYTLGQRKGLGIALGKPMYVYALRPCENEVVLASDDDMFAAELNSRDFNWMAIEAPHDGEALRCLARIRYRHKEAPCTVTTQGDTVKVVFDTPQRAITPGQNVVLYDGETVLGGGVINDNSPIIHR